MKNDKKEGLFFILKNNFFVLKIVWHLSKIRFLIKMVITVLSAILPTLNILIVRYVIDMLESNVVRTDTILAQLFTALIGLALMQLIPKLFLSWNEAVIEPILASRINKHMNELIFEKTREFDYKEFEDPLFFDKYTRALAQTDNITHVVFNTYFQLLAGILNLLALFAVIISLDGIVMLFASFTVVINFIQSIVVGKINFTTSQVVTPLSRKQSYLKRILYSFAHAKDIKCYDVISTGRRYYIDSTAKMIDVLKKFGFKVAFINTIVTILNGASSMFLMLYLVSKVWTKVYSIADYSALTSSAAQFEGALNALFSTLANFYKNSLEIDNLRFVLSYEKENDVGGHTLDCEHPCEIEIRNLYFKYPNANEYALKNISLKVSPGEKISIVGLNGSGKTTLIKLLLRLYDPESGDIYFNKISIKKYKKDELQKQIGVSFQEHNVFAYTAKENISFESMPRQTAIDVLNKLGMHSTISKLPKGINTQLSKEFDNDGTLLSGGEEQKICLARALNKASGLYILDEPSSALDPVSEYQMNSLMREATDKTVIFISHRLSSVVMADKIYLLENGELLESGSHDELLLQNGRYAELFRMQAEKYQRFSK